MCRPPGPQRLLQVEEPRHPYISARGINGASNRLIESDRTDRRPNEQTRLGKLNAVHLFQCAIDYRLETLGVASGHDFLAGVLHRVSHYADYLIGATNHECIETTLAQPC